MDILGIGVPELLFIALIALLLVGPRRLPEVMRDIGKYVRELRKWTSSFSEEWQREINATIPLDELKEARKDLQSISRLNLPEMLANTDTPAPDKTPLPAENSLAPAETKSDIKPEENETALNNQAQ